MEAIIVAGSVSMNASCRSTLSGPRSMPRARATASASRMTSASSPRVSGSSRIGPIGRRVSAVMALRPTMNTNFSQIARWMLSLSTVSMPALRQAS